MQYTYKGSFVVDVEENIAILKRKNLEHWPARRPQKRKRNSGYIATPPCMYKYTTHTMHPGLKRRKPRTRASACTLFAIRFIRARLDMMQTRASFKARVADAAGENKKAAFDAFRRQRCCNATSAPEQASKK